MNEWRVGEFWSSSEPTEKVLMLAFGKHEIEVSGNHHSFIRWMGSSETVANKEIREFIDWGLSIFDAQGWHDDEWAKKGRELIACIPEEKD